MAFPILAGLAIGALMGGGIAALQKKDILQGALMGGVGGALGGAFMPGIAGGLGGTASGGLTGLGTTTAGAASLFGGAGAGAAAADRHPAARSGRLHAAARSPRPAGRTGLVRRDAVPLGPARWGQHALVAADRTSAGGDHSRAPSTAWHIWRRNGRRHHRAFGLLCPHCGSSRQYRGADSRACCRRQRADDGDGCACLVHAIAPDAD